MKWWVTQKAIVTWIILKIHWKDWCWNWNTLATWCEELTYLKRPWCWERLKVGGEGDDRGWDCWMASPIQRTWVWVNSRSWWWTERPGVLQSMGSQRIGHDWATDLIWSLLFTAICKASPGSHFAFLPFFSMGMILIPVSCTMSWASVLPVTNYMVWDSIVQEKMETREWKRESERDKMHGTEVRGKRNLRASTKN